MTDKKYTVIKTIPADAPFGYINWLTISFLTPQKYEDTKYMDIIGFKVHNGYTIEENANKDCTLIKQRNKNHDIFPIEMGKLYNWDDIDKAEQSEYDNQKLNELEAKRRENADKVKLMKEQFKNEHNLKIAPDRGRNEIQERMRNNLYKQGKITKKELELMQEQNRPLKEVRVEAAGRERIEREAAAAFETDYLDLDEDKPLKFGCISIFTPKSIGNLKEPCFKIRGVFETEEEVMDRINQLKRLHPHDRVFRFKIGQWTVYTDNHNLSGEQQLQQLNYAMKTHLDRLSTEEKEFEERKKTLKTEAENEAKLKKMSNLKEKRAAKKAKRKAAAEGTSVAVSEPPAAAGPAPTSTFDRPAYAASTAASIETETDPAIRNLMEYLNDDALLGKFMSDEQSANSDPASRPERATIQIN